MLVTDTTETTRTGKCLAAGNLEAAHAGAELVVVPVIRSNADLVLAAAVAVDAEGAVGEPLVLPVNGLARTHSGRRAAAVVLTVPLASGSREDPGISHGERGEDGGKGSGGELHVDLMGFSRWKDMWKVEVEG